jgi:mannitol/fructose-specific phosphotransferase system IIA component (Ntr-type)
MQSVIHQLVQALCQQGRLDARHADRVIDEFLQRERLMTSALGRGFALPHIRSRLVSEFLGAIGIAPGGIDLASRDGKPTKLVVLIISPWEERERHLGLLSRVVNLTQDKTARLHWESANSLTKTWQHLADLDRRSIDSQGPIRRQAASE